MRRVRKSPLPQRGKDLRSRFVTRMSREGDLVGFQLRIRRKSSVCVKLVKRCVGL